MFYQFKRGNVTDEQTTARRKTTKTSHVHAVSCEREQERYPWRRRPFLRALDDSPFTASSTTSTTRSICCTCDRRQAGVRGEADTPVWQPSSSLAFSPGLCRTDWDGVDQLGARGLTVSPPGPPVISPVPALKSHLSSVGSELKTFILSRRCVCARVSACFKLACLSGCLGLLALTQEGLEPDGQTAQSDAWLDCII